MRRAGGFTLLEVLIALAIVAIGLGAALRASGAATDGLMESRSRWLALWLAEDIAAERTARGDWLDPGLQTRTAEMGGEPFLVYEAVEATPNQRFRRLVIRVAPASSPDHSLRELVVYLNRQG